MPVPEHATAPPRALAQNRADGEAGSARPGIWLAPMEGLLDHGLRDTLTRVGGVSMCVSEFIRVTDTVLPHRAFVRVVPELRHGGRTPAGVPVRVQLLGSDPSCLADNAAHLAALSPPGIDLNFGCPAKTVNRHRGGAVLLQEPELVGQIVAAVRRAVPAHIPVSAKMRLGVHDDQPALACAQAIEAAGASELVVHARTKLQGYRPPAYWDRIAHLREHVRLPIIANGEIWSVEDALRCRRESGCATVMIGRGLVSDPGLALALRAHDGGGALLGLGQALPWSAVRALMPVFWASVCARVQPRHRAGRLKQWLHYLRRAYPEAQQAFAEWREETDPARLQAWVLQGLPST